MSDAPGASEGAPVPQSETERIDPAQLVVHINHQKLRETHLPPHIVTPEKKAQLANVVEIMDKLPEQLAFEPGITLIVGENGSGKSTLAKSIYYAARFADQLPMLRNIYKGKTDDEVRVVYEDSLRNPKGGGSAAAEIYSSGLGPPMASSMLDGLTLTSSDIVRYTDIGEIYGEQIAKARASSMETSAISLDGDNRPVIATTGGYKSELGSNRQTVDEMLVKQRRNRRGSIDPLDPNGADSVVVLGGAVRFIDEPESGLSPRRHRNLEAEIGEVFGTKEAGDILIVPTNSVVLFDSDLPRIDLQFPERGIHRPSQFPDHDSMQPPTAQTA